jgi:hypothetical protein
MTTGDLQVTLSKGRLGGQADEDAVYVLRAWLIGAHTPSFETVCVPLNYSGNPGVTVVSDRGAFGRSVSGPPCTMGHIDIVHMR